MILTFSQQNAIKPISINNEAKYNQIATEVENLELNKLLGYVFYQKISSNQVNYDNLLNGCNFTDCNGNNISHKGLRYILAYLNYAAYIIESNVNDTFTGMVQKVRPDSEQISIGQLKNLQTHNREIAFSAWELTRQYIMQTPDLSAMFYKVESDKKTYSPKFFSIKKTKL